MVFPQTRFICIHGHFYQPPRENPWLEYIEVQESAHPYHDWNERIAEECYIPNTEARIVDSDNRLVEVVNNFEHISFNFGPTLLSWLERFARDAYETILHADHTSRKTRSGHGNAMAQAYNHMILPLASRRDKITQVVWGIRDFRSRFNRDPEGMWLPETAADQETLQVLVDHGIEFTVLSPTQAMGCRESAAHDWQSLNPGTIDPSRPYVCNLPNGSKITILFLDGPISHGIAFESLLNSAEEFVRRILAGFSASRPWTQLVTVATDGESYGHHHRFGEMALACAVQSLEREPRVILTNFGEFLDLYPPTAEVELIEKSSWSCAHGVGRWSDDCGCCLEAKDGWTQKWRKPLRSALNLLRDRADHVFEKETAILFRNPWEAREQYIQMKLADPPSWGSFIADHQCRSLTEEESTLAAKFLEMQRNRMLMYTSCGWFFDDITGLESMQILTYAARVMQLASPFDESLHKDFLAELSSAVSNNNAHQTADELFRDYVYTQRVDLRQVAAHVGIMSLVGHSAQGMNSYCYDTALGQHVRKASGQWSIFLGEVAVESRITGEKQVFVVAVLHLGGVDFRSSVKDFTSHEDHVKEGQDLLASFAVQSSTDLVRKMDRYFPGRYFTLSDIFAEERAKLLETITENMYSEQADSFAAFYRKSKDLARFIKKSRAPLPDTFLAAAGFVLNRALQSELKKLESGRYPDGLKRVFRETKFWGMAPDRNSVARLLNRHMLNLVKKLDEDSFDSGVPQEINKFLDLCRYVGVSVNLGQAQTRFFQILKAQKARHSGTLPSHFHDLANRLSIDIRSL
ncbi:MAG: DUF3536 domain-containing protein [Thermodesulfobacteriota bacterium]